MNKIITCFLLILFLLLTTSYPAVAYENLQHGDVIGGAHRQINQHGIEEFIETAKNDLFMSKYDFEPNAKKLDIKPLNSLVTPYELKSLFLPAGYYTTVPGDWEKDISEDVVYNKTFKQWVIDGGYTADEPERYMSLRHFYTPIGDGASYLTDIPIGGSIMMGDNPGIDAKNWALEHPDNKYSWNNGLKNLKLGFASGLGKDCYGYAAAWRSLGETMHLISDMTTPAHVRNDSHPGNYYATAIVADLRADPYEYITGHDGSLLAEAFNNPIYNSDLVGVINTSKTPDSLFDTVAKYVNLNFFSADTIPYTLGYFVEEFNGNGTSSFQSPDPRNYAMDANEDYIAPDSPGSVTTAASSSSEPLIGYHTSWLSANDWLSADGWVSAETISQRAVLSQARRLIPIAVNSTTKLADLFIPRVKLNYTGINLEKKVIEGEFLVYLRGEDGSYTAPDTSVGDMYQKLIIFVDIIEKDNSTKSYAYLAPPVEIVNNKFTISLSDLDEKCKLYTYVKTAGQTVVDTGTDDTEQPQIKISLGIDMGGILVRSGETIVEVESTPSTAYAAPSTGEWVLEKIEDQEAQDIYDETIDTPSRPVADYTCGGGSFIMDFYYSKTMLDYSSNTGLDKTYTSSGQISAVFTGLPERMRPGEEVTISSHIKYYSTSNVDNPLDDYMEYYAGVKINTENDSLCDLAECIIYEYNHVSKQVDYTVPVSFTLPDSSENAEQIEVRLYLLNYGTMEESSTLYTYRFVPDAASAIPD